MSKLALPDKLQQILDLIKTLDLAEIKGEGLTLTEDAEKIIGITLQAEEFFKDIDITVKERLEKIFAEHEGLKKIEGTSVQAYYHIRRSRKVNEVADKKFYELVKKPKVKAIEAYKKVTGELPEGVIENTTKFITYKQI